MNSWTKGNPSFLYLPVLEAEKQSVSLLFLLVYMFDCLFPSFLFKHGRKVVWSAAGSTESDQLLRYSRNSSGVRRIMTGTFNGDWNFSLPLWNWTRNDVIRFCILSSFAWSSYRWRWYHRQLILWRRFENIMWTIWCRHLFLPQIFSDLATYRYIHNKTRWKRHGIPYRRHILWYNRGVWFLC